MGAGERDGIAYLVERYPPAEVGPCSEDHRHEALTGYLFQFLAGVVVNLHTSHRPDLPVDVPYRRTAVMKLSYRPGHGPILDGVPVLRCFAKIAVGADL